MLTRTIDVGKEPPDLQVLLSLVAQGTEVVLTEGDTPNSSSRAGRVDYSRPAVMRMENDW
jgi:hypothetical protein